MTDAAAIEPWRLKRFAVLGSTSDLCRTLAEAGEPDGLAVHAMRQTQARGSRGRGWESPSGNLSLSVLLRPREPARLAGQWALLAGVALLEGLLPALPPEVRLTLKWPNDVLLDGRKLAGILLDSAADERGDVSWLVIGMGANLASAPEVSGRTTAAIVEVATPPLPDAAAASVLQRLAHWRRIRLVDGFAPIRAAWLARAQAVGTPMTLKLGLGTIAGTFAGLGDDGSLLLQTGGRVRSFATGEVLFPRLPGR